MASKPPSLVRQPIAMHTPALLSNTARAARFSTVGGESGSPDEARDPRGFALK